MRKETYNPWKRFAAYNGLVALGFLLFWGLIVLVEVKIHLYWFLSCLFFGSLPLVFAGVYFATWLSRIPRAAHPDGWAAFSSVLLSPLFILIGVGLIMNFKALIGGHF